MPLPNVHPVTFFGEFFAERFTLNGSSVVDVMGCIHSHPFGADNTCGDPVVHPDYVRKVDGRYRVFLENQAIWYYFVMDDRSQDVDPPVYMCSSLDLAIDHRIPKDEIVDGDSTMVSERFTDFLWQIIGQNLCLRNGPHDDDGILSPTFCGMTFKSHAKLDERFTKPETRWFQDDVFFADEFPGTICSPTHGAVFASADARDRFVAEIQPKIQKRWAEQ
ncbi:hypothetical protein NZK35_03565 [Stieleria sp. ICT_E10.1]|uniref:hypothetical protein n=1 Tax=Stieleria sedimenti TaxID=2976331 RepID=UPI00217F851F|nr:hypothetical protein [Stieleria sedimenti]MCS7465752.1 hypothetical protein [Stieleria sedimenti]